jgi:hypothetical protein
MMMTLIFREMMGATKVLDSMHSLSMIHAGQWMLLLLGSPTIDA